MFNLDIPEKSDFTTAVALKCFDSKLNAPLEFHIEINSKKAIRNDSIVKLGNYKIIRALEDVMKLNKKFEDDLYYAQKISEKEEIVRLSIKN